MIDTISVAEGLSRHWNTHRSPSLVVHWKGVPCRSTHSLRAQQISKIGFQMAYRTPACSGKRHITRRRDATSEHAISSTQAGVRLTRLSKLSRRAPFPRDKIESLAARAAQVSQRCFGHLASTPAFKCLLRKPLFFPTGIGSPLCPKLVHFRNLGDIVNVRADQVAYAQISLMSGVLFCHGCVSIA